MIVEDDPFIAEDIRSITESLGFTVAGVYHSPQAVEKHREPVDLAILDINLSAHVSGIDLAESLQARLGCAHMFITSYFDSTTVEKAGKTAPLAYITKPFEEKDLVSNLLLARSRLRDTQPAPASPPPAQHIFLKSSKSLVKIEPAEVDYVQAYDIYAKVVTDGTTLVASQNLKQLGPVFVPYGFVRVHKSYMVNLAKIKMIREDEVYIGDVRIPVGRAFKSGLLEAIQVI